MEAAPNSPSTSSTNTATTGPTPLYNRADSLEEHQAAEERSNTAVRPGTANGDGTKRETTDQINSGPDWSKPGQEVGVASEPLENFQHEEQTQEELTNDHSMSSARADKQHPDKENGDDESANVDMSSETLQKIVLGGNFGSSSVVRGSVGDEKVDEYTAHDDGQKRQDENGDMAVKSDSIQQEIFKDMDNKEERIRHRGAVFDQDELNANDEKDTAPSYIHSVHGYRAEHLVAMDLKQSQCQQSSSYNMDQTPLSQKPSVSASNVPESSGHGPVDLDVTIGTLDTTLDLPRMLKPTGTEGLNDTMVTHDTAISRPSNPTVSASNEQATGLVDLDDTIMTKDTAILKPAPTAVVSNVVDLDDTILTMDTAMTRQKKPPPSASLPSTDKGTSLKDPDTATSKPPPKAQAKTDNEENPTNASHDDWVNEGLRMWEESRKQWLSRDQTSSPQRKNYEEVPPPPKPGATTLDVDEIIDIIFLSSVKSSNNPNNQVPTRFPMNVPLPQMVDILQGTYNIRIVNAGARVKIELSNLEVFSRLVGSGRIGCINLAAYRAVSSASIKTGSLHKRKLGAVLLSIIDLVSVS